MNIFGIIAIGILLMGFVFFIMMIINISEELKKEEPNISISTFIISICVIGVFILFAFLFSYFGGLLYV